MHQFMQKYILCEKDMDKVPDTYGSVITGSSNFSEAGLQNNLEFNVELCGDETYYFLGLLNSHLLNWYFAKLSTNSNVNGYEVDNIPIKIAEASLYKAVENHVCLLLQDPNNQEVIKKSNYIVYEIYGISDDEKVIIEKNY